MRDATLRQKKDDLMVPMARRLFGSVHPNVISFVAMAVGLLTILAIVNQFYVVGLILWLLNRVLDGLDGVIARVHDKQSDFGGYLDLLLDFVIYLAVPIAFLWVAPTQVNLWAGIFLLAAYVINLLSWTTLSALLEKRRHSCPPTSIRAKASRLDRPAARAELSGSSRTSTFFLRPFSLRSAGE